MIKNFIIKLKNLPDTFDYFIKKSRSYGRLFCLSDFLKNKTLMDFSVGVLVFFRRKKKGLVAPLNFFLCDKRFIVIVQRIEMFICRSVVEETHILCVVFKHASFENRHKHKQRHFCEC